MAFANLGIGLLRAHEMGAPREVLDEATAAFGATADNDLAAAELAQKFAALQLEVAGAERRDLVSAPSDGSQQTAAEQRRCLRRQWDGIRTQIRAIPGFETFPHLPEQSDLLNSGRDGPVLLLNVSKYGSAAFIIRNGRVTDVALSDLTPATVRANNREAGLVAHYRAVDVTRVGVTGRGLRWIWMRVGHTMCEALGSGNARSRSELLCFSFCDLRSAVAVKEVRGSR